MFESITKHGTLIAVAVLIISVLGVVAALRIPVQMIPDLEVRTITVRTSWAGATPQDIEKEIVIEQEEYLRSVPGLQRIISEASFGQASIELEFPFGIDLNETLIRINNALSQVPSYPINVDEPRIFAASFSSNSFMYFRVMPQDGNPRNLKMEMMQDYIDDNVRPRMESVPGVSQVDVYGGAQRQIQILLDPMRLAQRNITIAQVRDAITERNRDVSGGELESGKRRYLLRTIGRFSDLEDLRSLILERRGDAVIRLGDVADVQLDHFELSRLSFTDGKPVIGMSVRRQPGSNVIDIKDTLLAQVAAINQELLQPAGMRMMLVADDVTYVKASLQNVWTNLIIGALLASLVMFLFLRSGKATLVGVIGIPICTIAAFIGLQLTGRTINVISLAGVAFAIGMTLDNSIVVLESIEHERRRGLERLRAAVVGVQKVWPAVLASTLTTVMVFLPILFIEEEAGQLYSDIAIAIAASILASMLVAITVIPAAAARLRFHDDPKAMAQGDTGTRAWVLNTVNRLLAGRASRWSAIVVTLVLCGGIYLFLTPAAEYLPEGEEPKTFARLSAPPGYNLETMAKIGREIQQYFLTYLEHDPGQFERGETEVPAMKYLNLSIDPNGIRIIAEPKKPAHIEVLMTAIDAKYREYPAMRPFVTRGSIITSNSGGTRSVNLDISGPDLAAVYAAANKAYQRAETIFDAPRLRANPSTLSLSQPLVQVRPLWERASEVGMNTRELGYTVAALTDGAFVDEFFLADDKIDIYLYSQDGVNATLDSLDQKQIYTPIGAVMPLSSIARIEETVDTNIIRRLNGQRTVTLNIIPPQDVALETGVARVREEIVRHLRAAGEVPSNITMSISGASDQLQATREALTANYIVSVAIIYLLLVAIFTHWGYPLFIMATIPLGVSGGFVGLALFNLVGGWFPALGMQALNIPFDMIAMLGFLILMGTVVNNPILIVHQSIANVREEQMSARDAVADAVKTRLRPIAMSTLTTVFGLAPLVFLPGEGTELYRGVGVIVMFGLLGTAVVALTFLPALLVTVLKFTQRDSGASA
ncbi:acriflavin resistance protein [Candidatus Tenderia electrophaga]|jgi:multidrug efflux pump subunit AcrB|uniref:Acriflavin resistance protein n=1 Tax=Candidatus Tenderia electrophaga TaxID=1748243 RepID=A0A0S2T9W6_9GAMM|nr:acriflavin resistance protein [Candidatus Tenderia electrophaga]